MISHEKDSDFVDAVDLDVEADFDVKQFPRQGTFSSLSSVNFCIPTIKECFFGQTEQGVLGLHMRCFCFSYLANRSMDAERKKWQDEKYFSVVLKCASGQKEQSEFVDPLIMVRRVVTTDNCLQWPPNPTLVIENLLRIAPPPPPHPLKLSQ